MPLLIPSCVPPSGCNYGCLIGAAAADLLLVYVEYVEEEGFFFLQDWGGMQSSPMTLSKSGRVSRTISSRVRISCFLLIVLQN